MSRMGELAYAQETIARIQRGSSIVPRDTRTGDMFKQEGISQTLGHESSGWIANAVRHIAAYGKTKQAPFSLDEFRQAWADLHYPEPHHQNVWGAVTRIAHKAGLIMPTGRWEKSIRPEAHARMVPLWESV